MATEAYPLYTASVLFPLLSFPAWILDIPPMVWQFSQQNVAAGSLILWITLTNFFNSINPLIWPRDDLANWWEGNIWCDIHVRIQVGGMVAMAASVTMIMRRLAKVMDTRNITVASSRNNMIKEKTLEIACCWGYPFLMMVVYYIIQPARFFIFGIVGCISAYDASWPSVVLGFMWGPITMCFASYYSGLLIFRLYVYRREFHRLIAARNTTKSRFLRLFIMSLLIIVIYLPYQFYILYCLVIQIVDDYDWNVVHGPNWNSVIKVPSGGQVKFDKWGQIGTGYIAFLVFSTGTDACNVYKRMLCSIGLGRLFPCLYAQRERGVSAPSSGTFVNTWRSTLSSKAKNMFSKNDSVAETLAEGTQISISPPQTPPANLSASLHPVSTAEPILRQKRQEQTTMKKAKSFMGRLFTRRNRSQPVLPSFNQSFGGDTMNSEKSPTGTVPEGIYTRAWASENAATGRANNAVGVHVVQEVQVHQLPQESNDKEKDNRRDPWTHQYP